MTTMQADITDESAATPVAPGVEDFVGSLESLFTGIVLYEVGHPVVATLGATTVEALGGAGEGITLGIGPVHFVHGESEVASSDTGSSLSQALHRLGVATARIDRGLSEDALLGVLDQIRVARGGEVSLEALVEGVAQASGGRMALTPVDIRGAAVRDAGGEDDAGAGTLASARLMELLGGAVPLARDCATTAAQTEQIARDMGGAGREQMQAWIADQSRGLRVGASDAYDKDRAEWLRGFVGALSPAMRKSMLEYSSGSRHSWFAGASDLAPVWPVEEIFGALEEIDSDDRRLTGAARLLFRRLGTMCRAEEHSRERFASLAAGWVDGSGEAMSVENIARLLGDSESDEHAPGAYADTLDSLALDDMDTVMPWSLGDLTDAATLGAQSAEIARELSQGADGEGSDVFVATVARSLESLVDQGRFDLIKEAMSAVGLCGESAGMEAGGSAESEAAPFRADVFIDALLVRMESDEAVRASVLELLGYVASVSVPRAVVFLGESSCDGCREALERWVVEQDERWRIRALVHQVCVRPGSAHRAVESVGGVCCAAVESALHDVLSRGASRHRISAYAVLYQVEGAWSESVTRRALGEKYSEPRIIALESARQDWDGRLAAPVVEFVARGLVEREADLDELELALRVLVEHANESIDGQLAMLLRDCAWDAGSAWRGRTDLVAGVVAERRASRVVARALGRWRLHPMRCVAWLGRAIGRSGGDSDD